MNNLNPPGKRRAFTIQFSPGQFSPAVQIAPGQDVQQVIDTFGLIVPRPVIYIIGGAGAMSAADIARTQEIIDKGIASFAHEHNITVISGGTEAGVMQLIGQTRRYNHYKFPLIGVAPVSKIAYPGWNNPQKEAQLDEGHSHFVLVQTADWGGESQTIVNLARRIMGNQKAICILINGGRIAEQEVYLATTKDEPRIPIIVLDGSGRAADDIGSAIKTGRTSKAIIKTIIEGGDIRLVSIADGPRAVYQKLHEHFLG